MSETKEKDDGREEKAVDALDSVRKASDTEQEDSFHSVEESVPEKMDMEIVAAEEDNVVESRQVEETAKPTVNGEPLPEKMGIEIVAVDVGNVEPACPSVKENGDDGGSVKEGGGNLNDSEHRQVLDKPGVDTTTYVKSEVGELAQGSDHDCEEKAGPSSGAAKDTLIVRYDEPAAPRAGFSDVKAEDKNGKRLKNGVNGKEVTTPMNKGKSNSKYMFLSDDSHTYEGNDSGTEEEQLDFMKAIENFFKERSMEFKPPKFYGDNVNCLKLYRIVTRLGGCDKVTSSKLWKQVGASFKPPRTCTTISYSFRGFYEKLWCELVQTSNVFPKYI